MMSLLRDDDDPSVARVVLIIGAILLGVTLLQECGARAAAQTPPRLRPMACPSYPADVVAVTDGDTFRLRIHLGFDVSVTAAIRLAGVDAPERFTPAGRRAAAAVTAKLTSGQITVVPTGARSFARWIAHVSVNGESLADWLRKEGHVTR